jgi:hypothetical protein
VEYLRISDYYEQPPDLASAGIDGLYLDGSHPLTIQNGTEPRRIMRLTLSTSRDEITGWRVLEQASSWLGEPNHGIVRGRAFVLIGNSGWERVGPDGRIQSDAASRPPVLLELPLDQ